MGQIVRFRNEQGIFADIAATFNALQNVDVNDLNEGGVLSTIMRVWAREHEETDFAIANMFLRASLPTASGTDLDLIGEEEGVSRHSSQRATGYVRLSKTSASPVDSSVAPIGSVIVSNGQVNYTNTEPCRIFTGATLWVVDDGIYGNTSIPFEASASGTTGNTGVGTVTRLVSSPSGLIDVVTNPEAFFGGTITESDADYRARIQLERDRKSGGTVAALLAQALRNNEVFSAAIYEWANTSAESRYVRPTPGEVWAYVFRTFYAGEEFAAGRLYPAVADRYVLTPENYVERARNRMEEVRGYPITLKVWEAYTVLVDPIVSLTVPKGYRIADTEQAESDIAQSIRNYLLTLKIGESVSQGHIFSLLGIPFKEIEISFDVHRNRTHAFTENITSVVQAELDEIIKPYGTFQTFGQISVSTEE